MKSIFTIIKKSFSSNNIHYSNNLNFRQLALIFHYYCHECIKSTPCARCSNEHIIDNSPNSQFVFILCTDIIQVSVNDIKILIVSTFIRSMQECVQGKSKNVEMHAYILLPLFRFKQKIIAIVFLRIYILQCSSCRCHHAPDCAMVSRYATLRCMHTYYYHYFDSNRK